MSDFKSYVAADGKGVTLTASELNGIVARWEWFSTARIIRSHITGEPDGIVNIISAGRGVSSLERSSVDISKLLGGDALAVEESESSADDIIERFLQSGDYRIVASDDLAEVSDEVRTEAEFSDEDDLVSEELAEIYFSQGLKSEALAIYRKLSLRNTEKSVYFAEIIDSIENNN